MTYHSDKEAAGKWMVRDFIARLIDDYKYGKISGEELCASWDEYSRTQGIFYQRDEAVKRAVEEILPETCSSYLRETELSVERDLKFWKGLKNCDYLIRYGKTFTEAYEEYLKTGKSRCEPVEYTDEYLAIEPEMERLVRAETGEGGWTGFCHTYWSVKKKVLKEHFGIDWKSIDDRFPGLLID